MESQELTGLTISVRVERMTVDLFTFLMRRDWEIIKDGIHTLDLNIIVTSASYECGTLVYWSADNPSRLNRLAAIDWFQLRTDEIIVSFDGVGNESDVSFESFDQLSRQLIGWLKWRFTIDVRANTKVTPKKTTEEAILNAKTRYRCTLVRNRVKANLDKATPATGAIGLAYASYQKCEQQNAFLNAADLKMLLNERTEQQAWEDEVNTHNAI